MSVEDRSRLHLDILRSGDQDPVAATRFTAECVEGLFVHRQPGDHPVEPTEPHSEHGEACDGPDAATAVEVEEVAEGEPGSRSQKRADYEALDGALEDQLRGPLVGKLTIAILCRKAVVRHLDVHRVNAALLQGYGGSPRLLHVLEERHDLLWTRCIGFAHVTSRSRFGVPAGATPPTDHAGRRRPTAAIKSRAR